jgi:hypothetical protein
LSGFLPRIRPAKKELVTEKNNLGQIIRSISIRIIRINRDFLKTAKKHKKKLLNNTQPSLVHIEKVMQFNIQNKGIHSSPEIVPKPKHATRCEIRHVTHCAQAFRKCIVAFSCMPAL